MLPSNSLEYDFINRNAAWNSVKLGEDLHEVTAIYDQLTLATCNIRSTQHGCRISAYLIIVTLTSQLRCIRMHHDIKLVHLWIHRAFIRIYSPRRHLEITAELLEH